MRLFFTSTYRAMLTVANGLLPLNTVTGDASVPKTLGKCHFLEKLILFKPEKALDDGRLNILATEIDAEIVRQL